jgi:hypothetical protein
MLSQYNKDTHLTLDDIVEIYEGRTKPEIQSALNILGVAHVETFRPADKKAGRPNNLYLRKHVEQAMQHIACFALEGVADAPAEDAASA